MTTQPTSHHTTTFGLSWREYWVTLAFVFALGGLIGWALETYVEVRFVLNETGVEALANVFAAMGSLAAAWAAVYAAKSALSVDARVAERESARAARNARFLGTALDQDFAEVGNWCYMVGFLSEMKLAHAILSMSEVERSRLEFPLLRQSYTSLGWFGDELVMPMAMVLYHANFVKETIRVAENDATRGEFAIASYERLRFDIQNLKGSVDELRELLGGYTYVPHKHEHH